jgi:hypothetical protein
MRFTASTTQEGRKMRKFASILFGAFAAFCLCALGQSAGESNAMSPVGAWDITITPDDPERLPFHGFHIYNFGGTQTLSNSGCNSIAPSQVHGLRCSDGYGVWKRTAADEFVQTFYLEVYNLDDQHFAFIKSRGVFRMEGRDLMTGRNEAFILIGTALENPVAVIPLGTETVEARRIRTEVPSE